MLMLRAPAGFVSGFPLLFSDAVMEQMHACIPQIDAHLTPESTHYTMIMGDHGEMAGADLIDDFAARRLPKREVRPE
jgi:hypothetical protein